MSMPVLYMKLEKDYRSSHKDVYLKDCASVYCADHLLQAKADNVKLYHFQKESMVVIDVTYIISKVTKVIPDIEINSLGETDIILECIQTRRKEEKKKEKTGRIIKILMVSAISLIGSMYTIMAYHNDVGISEIFARTCKIMTGSEKEGILVLEMSYSLGLGLGIVYFYNHIWNKRLTKDPTPIEVEMKLYERDVDSTIVDNADREGMEIDVDA